MVKFLQHVWNLFWRQQRIDNDVDNKTKVSMAKTRSDVKIDEDINRENEIDDTGDSMAKICNDNYNGVKVAVKIDEDIAVDVDIKNNRVSEVDGDDNYKHLKI